MKIKSVAQKKIAWARKLRTNQTPAEKVLWQLLRRQQMDNLKWRRQAVLSGFIVDFYCPSKMLVIELDGGYHSDPKQRAYDKRRTRILNRAGFKVKRYKNSYVLRDPKRTFERIRRVCKKRFIVRQWRPPHTPLYLI
jgi:very-short-patch-repair endonuclease